MHFGLMHNATGCVMCVVSFLIVSLQPDALYVWLHYYICGCAVGHIYIVCRREKRFVSTTVIYALNMIQMNLEHKLYSVMVAVPLPQCWLSKCTLLVLFQ